LSLIEHPAERRLLHEDPALIPGAIEEMLRFAPSVLYFRRNAALDTEVRVQKIAASDKVVLWYVSGNRDEEGFRDPDTYDVRRTPNDHLSFGGGGAFLPGRVAFSPRDTSGLRGAPAAAARPGARRPGGALAFELDSRRQVDAGAIHSDGSVPH